MKLTRCLYEEEEPQAHALGSYHSVHSLTTLQKATFYWNLDFAILLMANLLNSNLAHHQIFANSSTAFI